MQNMIIPKPLRPGDTVAMVALASAIRSDDVPAEVKIAEERLKSVGFKVKVDPTCYSHYGFFAGTDEERANALNRAFADPEIDGIWCIRGGYGCIRLLELLDWDMIAQHPKAFIGYSDITTLHSVLHERCHFVTYHGPMAKSDVFDGPDLPSLMHAIAGEPDREIVNLDGSSLTTLRGGVGEGMLVGGNVCLLATSCGTPYDLDTTGKLLFLEDIGEYTYSEDRFLQQLYLAGKFDKCAGVIFGGFTGIHTEDERFGFEMDPLLEQLTAKLHVPVVSHLQAGHLPVKVTLPFGRRYRLDADKGTLTLIG